MRNLNQIFAVTWLNILHLSHRMATSSVAIVGVAAVVLVFAAVMSMAKGFERTMTLAGAEDTAIVIRSGSTSELASGLSNEQVLIIEAAPGVLRDGDRPVVSAELFVLVDVPLRSADTDANAPFRGVGDGAFEVRDSTQLVEGRMFEPGKNELIVGRAAQSEFEGLDLGGTIKFGRTEWTIVGVFEADGGVAESELWTDIRVLQGAYRRGNSFQTVRVRLENRDSLEVLEEALKNDPRLDVDVYTERAVLFDPGRGHRARSYACSATRLHS